MPIEVRTRGELTPEQKLAAEAEARQIVKESRYGGSPYEPFIRFMERWSRDKDRGVEVYAVRPYMETAGRVAEANTDPTRPILGLQTYLNTTEEPMVVTYHGVEYVTPPHHARAVLVRAQALPDGSVERAHLTATEAIRRADWGVDKSHPVANAETSAVGRVLGFAGYGNLPGSSLSPAETLAATPQDAEPASKRATRKKVDEPELAFDELEPIAEFARAIAAADDKPALRAVGQAIAAHPELSERQLAYLQARYVTRQGELLREPDDAAA